MALGMFQRAQAFYVAGASGIDTFVALLVYQYTGVLPFARTPWF